MHSVVNCIRLVAGAVLWTSFIPIGVAQSENRADDARQRLVSAPKQQAFADSKNLYRQKDFVRADTVLNAANNKPAGSSQWYLESGYALSRLAFEFSYGGDAESAQAAALRALVALDQARQKSGPKDSPAELANIHELMGTLYERLLGDRVKAETNYATAVALAPKSGQAPALLEKLRAAKIEEQRKGRK